MPVRLAVVVSHPVQYFSPWFQHLAAQPDLQLRVFYLWDFGVTGQQDREFGVQVQWDIPLLDGYDHEFVENASRDPGTHHFLGLDNPALVPRVAAWAPRAILVFGYAYLSHVRLLRSRALRNVPILFRGDSHNLCRPGGVRPWLARQLRRRLLARADAFLAVGTANEAYCREVARDPQRVFRAPHFVDNRRFRAAEATAQASSAAWRNQHGIGAGSFVIGFVGKLDAKKRPLDLLRAFASLPPGARARDGRDAALLFVGDGQLRSRLEQEALRLGLSDVHFAPFHNQSAMPQVYAALDVLVLPSGSETWGLCVNEAMNLGVPAVVSDCVGCGPDLVVEGTTGWVFRHGDTADLQRVLALALDRSPVQREAMAEAARRHVADYSIDAATEGLRRAVRSVVGPEGRR